MGGRTIEKDGETYIVSENVKNLDTENLVDKDAVVKLLDDIKQFGQKTEKQGPKHRLPFAVATFEFEVYGKPVTVTAQLKRMILKHRILMYELLVTKSEAFELSKLFHGLDNLSLRSIVLNDGEKCTKIDYTRFKNFHGFKMKTSMNNTDLVCCKVEMLA